jgi:L-aspartate oxidase
VALLTKAPLGRAGSSAWAQGGVAAAVGADDAPAHHAADTLAAAAGLADPAAVRALTAEGPARVAELIALGARFDRAGGDSGEGTAPLALGREAAHGRARILHAGGDATGRELSRALAAAVRRSPSVRVFAGAVAADLLVDARGRVAGVVALHPGGRWVAHVAPAVVLATGGLGRLYARTTNPPGVTADGLAMAARAGARLVDLEMVQFHPTALAAEAGGAPTPALDPMPLVSEAVRGEGAVLVDAEGRRFMPDEHPLAELAPRDVVARALYRRVAAGERVFLDAREAVGERFPARFPTVFAACRRAGIDPRREPIPVSPAAHYHMGGVETDLAGRASLPGLWACGEAASTGVHGANRLASNSLLEGLVFGARVAADLRSRLVPVPAADGGGLAVGAVAGQVGPAAGSGAATAAVERRLRAAAWDGLGVVRDAAGIAAAAAEIERLSAALERAGGAGGAALETRNLLLAGRLVAAAAQAREESRGAHFRADFPAEDAGWRRRLRWVLDEDGEPVEAGGARAPAAGPAAAVGGPGR